MTGLIEAVETGVYRFPTDQLEADGTFSWDTTTAVTVTLRAAEYSGLGWTYSSPAAAAVVRQHLAETVRGRPVDDVAGGYETMRRACRNIGTKGLVAQAISAVDIAWWDLRARVAGKSLATALGRCRDTVPVYGSGGFTTQDDEQLETQVTSWAEAGCRAVKIKIAESWGTKPDRDRARVRRLAELAPAGVALMVDANGGYDTAAATRMGSFLDEVGVVWFEEPVSSDDVDALRLLRRHLRCDVAAGEYVADLAETKALLEAVDCLQLDATRCGGFTGWLAAAELARTANLQVSAHCAPALHAFVGAAVPHLRHVEWFADHARLEPLLVDGAPAVRDGALHPSASRPGHGMSLAATAERHRCPTDG